MKGSRARAGFVLTALLASSIAVAQTSFYVERLQAGRLAFAAGRPADAEQDLRVAAFGFVDNPRLLAEALARLAVVENSLGRNGDAYDAVARFIELERTTPVYATLAVESSVRLAFDDLIRTVPAASVAELPSLAAVQAAHPAPANAPPKTLKSGTASPPPPIAAGPDLKDTSAVLAVLAEFDRTGNYGSLVALTDQAIAAGADASALRSFRAHAATQRGRCSEALADFGTLGSAISVNPDLVADRFVCLVESGQWDEAAAVSSSVTAKRTDVGRAQKALAEHRSNSAPKQEMQSAATPTAPTATRAATTPAPATPAPSTNPAPDARMFLTKAGALMKTNRASEAVPLIQAVLASEPGNRSARLMLIEAATVGRQFQIAAEQVQHIGSFIAGEEVTMFYAAVSLYETGHLAEARALLERAKSGVASSPYVDAYTAKIVR